MREFICMEETPINTQKKIRQWISTGYEIEIISQSSFGEFDPRYEDNRLVNIIVITSLWRIKDK